MEAINQGARAPHSCMFCTIRINTGRKSFGKWSQKSLPGTRIRGLGGSAAAGGAFVDLLASWLETDLNVLLSSSAASLSAKVF